MQWVKGFLGKNILGCDALPGSDQFPQIRETNFLAFAYILKLQLFHSEDVGKKNMFFSISMVENDRQFGDLAAWPSSSSFPSFPR